MQNNDISMGQIEGFPMLKGRKFIPKVSTIFIEVSGRCNAKCPYCARRRFDQRYSGMNMSPVLFEQILDHLRNIGLLHRARTSAIALYNWGEPFLNREINDILDILKKRNLYAGVSSNFIVKPEVDEDHLQIIRNVTFSLSGFSQDSYGRIHGALLNRVLDNFEQFYERFHDCAPNRKIDIAWHRYKFNEKELWKAFKYFDRPGIRFRPTVAYLNDLIEMLRFSEGGLSPERREQAETDLFLDYISDILAYHKQRSTRYSCFMWDHLVIDEAGQLMLCCGMTHHDEEHVLGNVLEMSAEEIFQKKFSDPICNSCIASGVPRAALCFGNKPLPLGRAGDRFKLWHQTRMPNGLWYYIGSKVAKTIAYLPWGEKAASELRKMKNKTG